MIRIRNRVRDGTIQRLIIFMCALKKIKLKIFVPSTLFSFLILLLTAAAPAAGYTVKAGDTLYGIGLRHGVSVQELQEANGLCGHLIYPGQELTIPGQDNQDNHQEKGKSAPALPTATNASTSEINAPGQNPQTPASTGQTAAGTVTPPATSPEQEPAPEQAPAPEQDSRQSPVYYVVRENDCLYTIAKRHGTSVAALMQANQLTSPLIYPDQQLLIPVPATSQQALRAEANAVDSGQTTSRGFFAASARKILNFAASFLGTRYVYGGSSPKGFDCSGFVQYVFQNAGFNLPHDAAAQAGYGTPVERAGLQPGDLVFFSYYGSKGIDHVGIYAGNGEFIHASTKRGVTYSSLSQSYYLQNYRGARRLLDR